jgi:flagellar protein FlaF
MLARPLEAYRTVQKNTQSGRELEASVLTKAAMLLQNCQNAWDAGDREQKLGEALRYTQKIWTYFQSELAQPENPLPKKLREDLLSLSIFIDKRIFELMAYPTPEKLTVLININLNIAAGLRGS